MGKKVNNFNKRTIIRKAKDSENPYTMIAKSAVQDGGLSWKATGLLCYILSLPDDWQIYVIDLASRKTDGNYGTKTALKELIARGYVKRAIIRNEMGHFVPNNCPLNITPCN